MDFILLNVIFPNNCKLIAAECAYHDSDNWCFIGSDGEHRSLVLVAEKLWRLILIPNPNCDLGEKKNFSGNMLESVDRYHKLFLKVLVLKDYCS